MFQKIPAPPLMITCDAFPNCWLVVLSILTGYGDLLNAFFWLGVSFDPLYLLSTYVCSPVFLLIISWSYIALSFAPDLVFPHSEDFWLFRCSFITFYVSPSPFLKVNKFTSKLMFLFKKWAFLFFCNLHKIGELDVVIDNYL